jgi:hypothetical protein
MSAITVIIGIVLIIIFAYFVIKGLNEYFVNQREVEKAKRNMTLHSGNRGRRKKSSTG